MFSISQNFKIISMNLKKFIFKKRYLVIAFFAFIIPVIIFASVDQLTYTIVADSVNNAIFRRQAGTNGDSDPTNASVANAAICVNNNTGGSSHTYFVSNKTKKEIDSFFTNPPYGVTVSATSCCGDFICNGTETCSNCTGDCGSCFVCGNTVTGVDGLTYGTVLAANGKCWLDRNLGATRVAQSATDSSAYGYLYQWGRGSDGHQIKTSPTITTTSSSDTPGHNQFIITSASPYNWRSPANDNLWQGVNGVNNPCPVGFRIPTQSDWGTFTSVSGVTNTATAYSSVLKLTVPGNRDLGSGVIVSAGSTGLYWSSTIFGADASALYFYSSSLGWSHIHERADGMAIRCIYQPVQYTLQYNTTGNGSVSGNTTQLVDSGSSGTAVTAVPADGYYFVNWSDGSTANPRTDTNVTANKTVNANFALFTCGNILFDVRDNNSYPTAQIGSQCWTIKNAAYLPSVRQGTAVNNAGLGYYVYGYNGTTVATAKALSNYINYGALYNNSAALTACPSGWHIPSNTEFQTLTSYNDSQVKATSSNSPVVWNGNNSSGFTAIPGGWLESSGLFTYQGSKAYFWTATQVPGYSKAYAATIWDGQFLVGSGGQAYGYGTSLGMSVRCVKN